MENNENLKILKELHAGAQMGIKAISYVSEKVEDDNLKKELSAQYDHTSKISEILIQGKVFGIIEGRKILNHNPNAKTNIKNTLNEFV